MGINGRLLVNFANALDVANILGILTEKKTRMRCFDLTMSFLFLFGLLQSLQMRLGQNAFVFSRPFLQTL